MKSHTVRRLVSVADQGGQAFGNLVVTVLLARWLPVEGFAEIATALTVWFFFESLQRTGIIMPFIADVPEPQNDRNASSGWFVINLMFLTLGTALLFALTQFFDGTLGAGFEFAYTIVPTAGLYFYVRRVLYHEDRAVAALCISMLNIALMFVVLMLMYLNVFEKTSVTARGLYVGAYLLSGSIGLFLLRKGVKSPTDIWSHFGKKIATISEMSLGATFAYFYNNGIQLFVAGFAASVEAAAFSATRVLVRPINVISTAFSDIERSAASKAYSKGGDAELDGFVKQMFVILSVILLPIGGALILFTPELLSFLFVDKYADFEWEARLWILALVPQIIALPLDIKQSVKQQSGSLLIARFAGAVASILTVVLGVMLVGGMHAWIGIVAVGSGRTTSLIVMAMKTPRA